MILMSSLMLLVAGVTVSACVTAVACIQTVAGILAVAGVLFKFLIISCCWSFCYPGVTNCVVGVSAIPFKHAVAGGPAVDGFLAVASVPAHLGVPILAGGFTYWIEE
jgi:hypothetical protein